MDRKLASIQRIISLEPITGADAILVAQVLGWKCVVKKNEFKVGDLCVYFEIDSILPIAQWNDHLRKGSEKDKPLRVRTIRLRGQLSQGLALPLTGMLPLFNPVTNSSWEIDDEVTDMIGVKKYEPYIPPELSGVMRGNFPSFIPTTDEIRLQAKPSLIDEVGNTPMFGTVKMDGASITAYVKDGVFGVCSRKIDLERSGTNSYWRAAKALSLEEKMIGYGILCNVPNFAIQGELCGPGIQGNKMGLKEITVMFYNIYFIDSATYGCHGRLKEFCEINSLEMVPTIYTGPLNENLKTLDGILEFASSLNYANGTPAEGIVWRSQEEKYSEILKGRLSFKTISSRFLLHYNE